jgi:cytochrome c peroxidase
MRPGSVPGRLVLALLPVAAALSAGALARRAAADDALAAWRAAFARPAAIPTPAGNPVTPQKVDLGRALFMDTRLSGDGTMACVTCHDPALSFSDGVARRLGQDGEPLPRRTPSLWNLAWGLTFFWDGRARASRRRRAGRSRTAARWAATPPRRRRALAPIVTWRRALPRRSRTIRASPMTTSRRGWSRRKHQPTGW